MASGTDLKAMFTRYFEEGTNKGNLNIVEELFAPDYKHHDPANPDVIVGNEGVTRHIQSLRGAFPDLVFHIDDMVSDGEKIVIRWTANVTHTGDYFGIPPTGKSAVITGMNTWQVQNGKAVEGWVNRDDIGLAQQLGWG
jgi:steroid delta-isomerase-like uncharacterized protein